MRYRRLGSSGIEVSEIGFGAWGIGGWTPGQLSYGKTDDKTSLAALERALDLGITLIDTANLYGLGRSETLIGQVLHRHRDHVVLATKAGFVDYATAPDYSPAAIERSLEVSLARLGTDHVDLLQLHSPPVELLRRRPEVFDSLGRLRERGLTRACGYSAAAPEDAAEVLRLFPFDAVQVNLSLLDVRALQCGLLDIARDAGAGIIARTPLAFGFLSGGIGPDTVFPPEDHRSRWNGPQVARWSKDAMTLLAFAAAGKGETAVQTALRFCLSFPGVSAVIPGITTVDEAVENASASGLGPLPPGTVEAIMRFHQEQDPAPIQRNKLATRESSGRDA